MYRLLFLFFIFSFFLSYLSFFFLSFLLVTFPDLTILFFIFSLLLFIFYFLQSFVKIVFSPNIICVPSPNPHNRIWNWVWWKWIKLEVIFGSRNMYVAVQWMCSCELIQLNACNLEFFCMVHYSKSSKIDTFGVLVQYRPKNQYVTRIAYTVTGTTAIMLRYSKSPCEFRVRYRQILLAVSVLVFFTNNCDAIRPAYASCYWTTVRHFFGNKFSYATKRVHLLGTMRPIIHMTIKSNSRKCHASSSEHEHNSTRNTSSSR